MFLCFIVHADERLEKGGESETVNGGTEIEEERECGNRRREREKRQKDRESEETETDREDRKTKRETRTHRKSERHET